MAYVLILALIAGLLMFLLCKSQSDAKRIGEMLLFASFIAFLVAVAPATVRLLGH